MAELSAVPFSALPQASDGYTVLYENDQVCRSEKKLSELVGNKTSSFLTKEQGDSLYQEKGDYLVDDDITGKLDKEQYANDSATFLTAHQDISNKLDTTAFSTVSSNFLTAHQNLDEYATLEWVNNQGFLKEHQPISANEWNDVYETVVTNSGTWSTETDWTDDINAASAYAYEKAVEQIPTDYYPNTNPSGFISGVDLSNYYEKSATSGKTELSNKFETKQDLIENKKDSSIPYLETANSNPSWETIETYKINAHGTAVEGELYDIPINGRTYKVVCLNGKLWLAENYVDEQNATYTDEEYGSYFTKSQMDNCVPEGWRLPTDADFQELITNEPDHCEKYFSTNWHTDETSPNYVTCTNELKLNLQPGGEYNSYGGTVNSKTYLAYYGTSTKELKSQSTQLQRVYYKLENYVDSTTKMFTKCWGNYNDGDYSYKVNVRLIKDDLEVPAPDGWKKFNGKNFMAIADDEGNTFKDFYLKTSAAQQLYQPKGDYASSAGATVLNTYYGLTTTGWKDISTNYYDKQTIDNMIAGAGGDYVPLSATDCRIGSKNKNLDDNNIFAQGAENSAGAYSLSQGKYNYSNFHSLAQGQQNSANSNALAQGMNNSANGDSLAQGTLCYAINESIAQGENNSAMNYSFAQGKNNSAYNYGFAAGTGNSANTTAAALGQNCSSYYWSIANGDKCSATDKSLAQGERTYADWYSLSQGFRTSAKTYSLSQGNTCYATQYSFAQGMNCSSYGYESFAQGSNCVATGSYSFAQGNYTTAKSYSQAMGSNLLIQSTALAIGEYNKTTNSANENAAFVIGNGTNNNRSDAFVVYKNGIASGGDFITSAGKKLSDCITTLPTNYVTSGDEISGDSQYALTTAGWEEITGGGNGGAYVPLDAIECTIGSGNTSISGSLAQGENNSAGYIIVYPEETIEDEVIPEHSAVLGYSFAQGKDNLSYSSSLAQGVSNSATHVSFAQGFKNYSNSLSVCFGFNNSAEGFSFSLGNSNTAYENSFAQGLTTTAAWYSVAMGNSLSANAYSVAVGSGLTASIYSFNFGVNNFAEKYSQTFGYGLKATNYATAYGYDGDVVTLGSFVIGEFNKTSAAPFVIGNGTFEGNRSDLFVVDKDGNVSAQGQFYAGGGVLGAALDTLELAPDNETIEFVTSSHNVVNGGSSAEEYTVIKIKTSLLNKINELYNLVSSNSGNSNWTSPQ